MPRQDGLTLWAYLGEIDDRGQEVGRDHVKAVACSAAPMSLRVACSWVIEDITHT